MASVLTTVVSQLAPNVLDDQTHWAPSGFELQVDELCPPNGCVASRPALHIVGTCLLSALTYVITTFYSLFHVLANTYLNCLSGSVGGMHHVTNPSISMTLIDLVETNEIKTNTPTS